MPSFPSFPEELTTFLRDAAAAAEGFAKSFIGKLRWDWRESSDAHIFKSDLPGMTKEDVKIEVEDDRVLKISGDRKKEEAQNNEKWYRHERSHGNFIQQFQLPENAKMNETKANIMEEGFLAITIPKVSVLEGSHPKRESRIVQISG